MIPPVVWLSLRDETPPRGYWDQALIEALFAHDLWTPQSPVEFGPHVETHDPADVPDSGAVVVLPGRYHGQEPEVSALRRMLRRMSWALVIVTGDEEGVFLPEWPLVHDRVRVWVQTPPLDRPLPEGAMGLENGWPPGIREHLREIGDLKRRWEWIFAGQVTHERREACVRALRKLEGGHIVATEGFTQGVPQADYWSLLAQAKVAPCPSGPETVDTFRVYEALEAGCVPLVDGATPDGASQHGYWSMLWGEDPPFPVIADWERDTDGWVRQIVRRWPADANAAAAWWLARKRTLSIRLHETVRDLSGVGASALGGDEPRQGQHHTLAPAPDDLITIVMPTSPTPFHPSTDHLEETLASIRERLPRAEIILVADGVRSELAHRHDVYQEYLRRVVRAANLDHHNVLPLILPAWGHQANATKAALKEVRTPLLLFVEHDTPLVGEIDWGPLIEMLLSGEINVARFYHEGPGIHPEHRHVMLDDCEPWPLSPFVPLVRTVQWSQRPHLARTDFYADKVLPRFRRKGRTMIEDVIHGVQSIDYQERGEASWWDWRTVIYAADIGDGLGIKRSTHLDSRGTDSKFAMVP